MLPFPSAVVDVDELNGERSAHLAFLFFTNILCSNHAAPCILEYECCSYHLLEIQIMHMCESVQGHLVMRTLCDAVSAIQAAQPTANVFNQYQYCYKFSCFARQLVSTKHIRVLVPPTLLGSQRILSSCQKQSEKKQHIWLPRDLRSALVRARM